MCCAPWRSAEAIVAVSLPSGTVSEEVDAFLEVLPRVVAGVREKLGAPSASVVRQEDALVLDALGKLCPLPVIELAKVIGEVPVGGTVRVLADDAAARQGIPGVVRDARTGVPGRGTGPRARRTWYAGPADPPLDAGPRRLACGRRRGRDRLPRARGRRRTRPSSDEWPPGALSPGAPGPPPASCPYALVNRSMKCARRSWYSCVPTVSMTSVASMSSPPAPPAPGRHPRPAPTGTRRGRRRRRRWGRPCGPPPGSRPRLGPRRPARRARRASRGW
ncbi:hypothetical protein SGLAM104S_06057 [Streptomyces glaucescens]